MPKQKTSPPPITGRSAARPLRHTPASWEITDSEEEQPGDQPDPWAISDPEGEVSDASIPGSSSVHSSQYESVPPLSWEQEGSESERYTPSDGIESEECQAESTSEASEAPSEQDMEIDDQPRGRKRKKDNCYWMPVLGGWLVYDDDQQILSAH